LITMGLISHFFPFTIILGFLFAIKWKKLQ
jgi:hypothetical protein